MAWVTKLGPSQRQGDYRLLRGAGCGLAQGGVEPALGEGQGLDAASSLAAGDGDAVVADRVLAYRMEDRAERALTWVGRGLAEVGLVAGADLASDEDLAAARALMSGVDPRTGATLLEPKVAADPRGKLPARPYVEALRDAADARGITVGELTDRVKAVERIGRLVRGVAREGGGHYAPVKDLAAVAAATGVPLEAAYGAEDLEQARTFADAKVRVGNRGYDLTLDLPKSISLLYGIAETPMSTQIEDAFAGVVGESVAAMEEWASYGMTGHHGGGTSARRIESSGLLGWVMWHSIARPVDGQTPDPHLHAHAVIANLVYCCDGEWHAPGNGGREIHRHAQVAGALTQARMRRELTEAYGIGWVRDEHTGAWEIAQIGREVRTVLSKRAGQVDAQLTGDGIDPATATRAQAKTAAAKSRQPKSTTATAAAGAGAGVNPGGAVGEEEPRGLRALWRGQLAAAGVDAAALAASVVRPGAAAEVDPAAETLAEEIFAAERALTAHTKKIGRADIITAVCDTLPSGVASLDHANGLVDQVLKLPACPVVALPRAPAHLTHNDRYTTPDILHAELSGLDAARTGYDGGVAVLPEQAVLEALARFERDRGFVLSPEQQQVATRLMTGGHGVDAVIGVAGSGKTVLMAAVAAAYRADGKSVHGAATPAVTAAGLQAETGIDSATVASWMLRIKRGHGLAGVDVLVVDEAAMVDDREFAALLEAAKIAGTKVIGIGDPQQLRAVGVGGLFAAIHRQVDGLTMYDNRRQRDPLERRALQLWRSGRREEALAEWRRGGHVHAGQGPADTMDALLADWAAARAALYSRPGAGGWMDVHEELSRLLILAGTNADVDALNTAVRDLRCEAGELGPDRIYQRADGSTLALAVGDHVRVRQNSYRTRGPNADPDAVDVLNGYRGRITQIADDGSVLVEWRRRTSGGQAIEQQWLSTAYIAAGGLSHGTAMTVASAQGMTSDIALVYGLGLGPGSLYSAMSRARDRTELYLPLNVLETDADRVQHGPPRDGEHALARTIAAYLRTLTGGPDTLVAAELGLEPDPIAHTPGLLPEPLLDELARLQQLTLIQQQQRLNDRTAAAQAERARAGFDGRGDAGGQHGGVEHWTRRPLGHHTDEHLAHLAGQAAVRRQRELLDVQRHLVDAHASLISARVGTGPAVQALRGRLRELQAAAEAGVRARELEAAQRAAYTANRTDLERLQDLSRLQDRNALFLLIANRTTRTQIRARIRDLRGDVDERTRYAEQLQKPAAAARQQARHPDTTGGYDARHQRNDQQVITDLRRLREGWDTLHAAALAGDVADADNQLAGAELRHTAATAPGPRTRAVADELATRRALPGRHAAAETAQRAAHHAAQAEQAQKQARQEAERLRAQRGPHPHRPPIEPDHGPGHSWGR